MSSATDATTAKRVLKQQEKEILKLLDVHDDLLERLRELEDLVDRQNTEIRTFDAERKYFRQIEKESRQLQKENQELREALVRAEQEAEAARKELATLRIFVKDLRAGNDRLNAMADKGKKRTDDLRRQLRAALKTIRQYEGIIEPERTPTT
jgi:chromosome segregation ATPase